MRAEVLGRAMRGLGGCLIGALLIPFLGVASAVIGLGILVGVLALCPRPVARAWLGVTVVLATVGTVGLVAAVVARGDVVGARVLLPLLVVALGGAYAQGMGRWFDGDWPTAARRFHRAARTAAIASALGAVSLVGYVVGPAAGRHQDPVLFGHRYPHGPGWTAVAVVVTVASIVATIQLMVANGPTARALRRRDGLAPGFGSARPAPASAPAPTATS